MSGAILIVEDDDNDVFFLTDALAKAEVGTPVQVVHDGRQAIEYLKGQGKYAQRAEYPFPCLVLLDLKLPHISGLDVLAWIRSNIGWTLPVLPVSSSDSAQDVAEAYRLGANGYLVKPIGIAEYLELAKALKTFWLTLNRAPEQPGTPAPQPSPSPGPASPKPTRPPRGQG